MSAEINKMITIKWQIFGEYIHFLKDKKIPKCLKIKIMETSISTGALAN